MKSLHDLPRFGDRLSYLYVDRAIIDQSEKAIVVHQFDGRTQVPVASLATLMLGPAELWTPDGVSEDTPIGDVLRRSNEPPAAG